MNRFKALGAIRDKLGAGRATLGSWMQLPASSVAEIMGQAGYDWVAADLEHGSFSSGDLPDIFRALELGGTLPLARVAQSTAGDCKQVLEAGAAGVILPMIESGAQLQAVVDACRWPPGGSRGVGFSRANLFGKHFADYAAGEAQVPLVVAMIEHRNALDDLDAILAVPGLDAVFIGPYDLSASMGLLGRFDDARFVAAIDQVRSAARRAGIAYGMHVVDPDPSQLRFRLEQGHQFVAYAMDAVLLHRAAEVPHLTTIVSAPPESRP